MRGELFSVIPGSVETWHSKRTAFVETIAAAEAAEDWTAAVVAARRALKMLPLDDTRRGAIEKTLTTASEKQAGAWPAL